MWESAAQLLSRCSIYSEASGNEDIRCGICKRIMVDACQIICGCRFCRGCIESHVRRGGGRCPVNGTQDCLSVTLSGMEDIHVENETNRKVMKMRVTCPEEGCKVEEELSEMIEHVKTCNNAYGKYEEEKKEEPMMLGRKMELITKNVEDNIRELNGLMEGLKNRITSLEERREKENKTMDCLENTLKDIERRIHEEKNEDFIWKIEGYSGKKKNNEIIYSVPFYTRKNIYKLRLLFYPNGSDSKGTHLSIYFELMKGEYDDILPWPFKYDIILSVMDQEVQDRDESITFYFTTSDKYKYIYEKPTMTSNGFYGFPKFLSISILESSSYLLKNDTLYVKCSVKKGS